MSDDFTVTDFTVNDGFIESYLNARIEAGGGIDALFNPVASPEIVAAYEVAIVGLTTPAEVVTAVLDVLDVFGYDSLDREALFTLAAARFGWDYDVLYNTWLEAGR